MAEQIYEVREKGGSKRAQVLVWGTEWFCQYNRVKKGVGGAKDTGGLGTSSITRSLADLSLPLRAVVRLEQQP